MELYTLDKSFKRQELIDNYETVIWTERYNDAGDTTVKLPWTSAMKKKIDDATFFEIGGSDEIMLIESKLIEKGVFTVSGVSLVGFLNERMYQAKLPGETTEHVVTDIPANIALSIVRDMCCAGGAMDGAGIVPTGAQEIIPGLTVGPDLAGTAVEVSVSYGPVFEAVQKIVTEHDLGFSLYLESVSDTGYSLKFKVYEGVDRTSTQTAVPAVVLEPATDSLTDVTELRSVNGYRNAAYVWGKGYGYTYAGNPGNFLVGTAFVDPALIGFDRRTISVRDTTLDITQFHNQPAEYQTALDTLAKNILANNNYVKMVDGHLVPQSMFTFGVNYKLGDIVELHGMEIAGQKARITEHIRSADTTGEADYPTLTML